MLALIPLGVLLIHSQTTLGRLGKIAASEAEYAVSITRHASQLEGLSMDIERLVRQYQVLKKAELKDLTENYVSRFNQLLHQLCDASSSDDIELNCQNLTSRINSIMDFNQADPLLLDAQLAEFRQSILALQKQTDSQLDIRIEEQRAYVRDVQQTQAWLMGILVFVSLVLIMVGSQIILRPVEKLENMIRAIARQQWPLPEVSKSGPKELIDLERKLHWLSERLNQLEHLRQALLRHAAHELKTPLASIKEGCALLTEQVVGPLNQQQVEVMHLLNSSTQRLNMLIEQLLDYNLLLQQAKPQLQWHPSAAILNAFVQDNQLAIQQHGNELQVNSELELVWVDGHLFRRVLDNLLSNALAHGARGRPVFLRLYRQENKQILELANNGGQIPAEMRNVIFEPFKRGNNKRNDRVVGSGLGLSIVADCARMMHGFVEIVDVDYADVCFRVSIPVDEE